MKISKKPSFNEATRIVGKCNNKILESYDI